MSLQAARSVLSAPLLAGLLVSAATAFGQTPPQPITQDVVYKIHSDPNDPNSPVTFTIWPSLEEAARDGNSIGWEIVQIRFRQVADAGQPDTIWMEYDANVPTADGLWWVDHADGDNPQLAEFGHPPHLVGTATAEDPSDANLKYSFEGGTYEPRPSGDPWDPTTALKYVFRVDGDPTPFAASDEDEPVEIDDDDDPPVQ